MESGKVVDIGNTQRIADRYLELNFSAEARAQQAVIAGEPRRDALPAEVKAQAADAADMGDAGEASTADGEVLDTDDHRREAELRFGDRRAEIVEAWFEDEEDGRSDVLSNGRRASFHARVKFKERIENPLFGVELYTSQNVRVWGANNVLEPEAGVFEAGDEVVFSVTFLNVLSPDRYWASPAAAWGTQGNAWLDKRERFTSVVVKSTRPTYGVVDLDSDFTIMPAGPVAAGSRPDATSPRTG
jgi:hypothetical protein